MIGLRHRVIIVAVVLLSTFAGFGKCSLAQSLGVGQFGAWDNKGVDRIDLSTLDVVFNIPVLSKPGRGIPLNASITHDNNLSFYDSSHATQMGWQLKLQNLVGTLTFTIQAGRGQCTSGTSNYTYTDIYGIAHLFPAVMTHACQTAVTSGSANDNSGYFLSQVSTSVSTVWAVTTPNGAVLVPYIPTGVQPQNTAVDNNGNTLTLTPTAVFDTLSSTSQALTISTSNSLISGYSYLDASGVSRSTGLTYASYPYAQAGYACSSIFPPTAYSGTIVSVPTAINLPNGTSYRFTYETASNSQYGTVTDGRVLSMTLPTGGTVQYGYSGPYGGTDCYPYNGGTSNGDGGTDALTRTTSDGTWTYTRVVENESTSSNTRVVTTVVDPMGNTSVYYFMPSRYKYNYETYLEIAEAHYAGAATGTPLVMKSICYNNAPMPCSVQSIASALNTASLKVDTYTSLNGGPAARDSVQYGSLLLVPTETDKYDYGATVPTTKTLVQYWTMNGSPTNKPSMITVEDSSSNILSQTKYGYDEGTLASTSGVPQHAAITGSRGNLTSISRWRNTDNTWLTTTYTNDDTGNRVTVTDANANMPTHYSYTDSWYSGISACPVTGTNAFLTQTTDPLGHVSKLAYDACTGLVRQSQNPNDLAANRTGTVVSYDLVGNKTSVQNADGGGTTTSYGGYALPLTITTSTLATPNPSIVNVSIADTYGRIVKENTTSDPGGIVYVDTAYDSLGRTQSTSNPYRSTSESTYGKTSHFYDALSRETKMIPPDGAASANNVAVSYSGNTTTTTDQAGVSRQSTTDAFGRLTQVTEVNTGWITQYQYDALGNLLCVEQHGGVSGTGCASSPSNDATSPWRVRRFTYNSLSQLLTSSNPETGTATYSYDANGNTLLKTDARGISTNYSPSASPIDGLNRVTQKTYSNGDPTVTYTYDSTSATNGIGRRTGISAGIASTTWNYDSMGRTTSAATKINGISKTTLTSYDLNGSPYRMTYPSGSVLQYVDGASGRVLSVTDTTHSINYAGSLLYTPDGNLSSGVYGAVAGGFAGITKTNTYNKRLQPTLLSATTPSSTIMSLGYNFGLGTNDNGNVYGITNNKTSSRSQSFLYDGVNRLTSAKSGTWGATFTIDAWGNYTATNAMTGLATPNGPQTSPTLKNGLTAYAGGYDGAGNLQTDGLNNYTFDAESRIQTVAGVTYAYDGDGERVSKSNGTLYWGNSESDLAGNLTAEYVFDGDKRVARRDVATGNVYYYFSDHLGSSNVVTNALGIIQNESDFYPFGGEAPIITALANQKFKFTGKERDTESVNDYFGARFYRSNLGRFMSPDDGSDQDPSDPQSWNLYGYVRNNPLRNTDPTGNACVDGVDDDRGGESCAQVAGADAEYHRQGKAAVTVTADFDKFDTVASHLSNLGQQVGNVLSNAAQQVSDYITAPRDPGCMASSIGAGAAYGGIGGGVLGGVGGGAGGTLVAPGFGTVGGAVAGGLEGAKDGSIAGGAVGGAFGFVACMSGGGGKTDHGQQRANEAAEGDNNRQVGDPNKVIREGKQYTDADTGNTVHVSGNRVVITDAAGEEVTQFVNSRANT